jgi:hypothetical protein
MRQRKKIARLILAPVFVFLWILGWGLYIIRAKDAENLLIAKRATPHFAAGSK